MTWETFKNRIENSNTWSEAQYLCMSYRLNNEIYWDISSWQQGKYMCFFLQIDTNDGNIEKYFWEEI